MDFGNFTSQRMFSKNKHKKRHTHKNDKGRHDNSRRKGNKSQSKSRPLDLSSIKSMRAYERHMQKQAQKRRHHHKKKPKVESFVNFPVHSKPPVNLEKGLSNELSGKSDPGMVPRNDSNICALRLEPRDVMIVNREVDEDEVNKLVMRFKDKPKVLEPVPLDVKSQLVLDRVVKKSQTPTFVLKPKKKKKKKKMRMIKADPESRGTDERSSDSKSQPGNGKKNQKVVAVKDISNGKNPSKPIISSKESDDDNKLLKTAADEEKNEEEEKEEEKNRQSAEKFEKYDMFPKLEEVLKMEKEDVFDLTGLPKWMEYLEPKESDSEGVEPPYAVGSEHIEMFHDRKLKMKSAPTGKIILDQWLDMSTLLKRDDIYFTAELIFCNTLKSLINVSSSKNMSASKRKKPREHDENEMKTQCDEEDVYSVTVIPPNPFKYFSYSRMEPICSASRRIVVDKSITPKKEKKEIDDGLF